ncbi:MAG: glycosyltransferase family 4 protein [Granulosicoccus sp.]
MGVLSVTRETGRTITAMDARQSPASPRLGIIISMFPELHETFILRELVALERRGMRFDIFSLQYPRDPITIDDAIRLSTERTSYSGLLTADTLLAFARAIASRPLKLFKVIAQVIWKGRDRPLDVLKNLAVLPLSLHIGEQGKSRGITHWHGHWANIPTTACWFLGHIHGNSWSAAIHGEDIFSPNRFLHYKLNDALFSVVCSAHFCNHIRQQMDLDEPEHVHLNYHGLDPRVTQRKPVSRSTESVATRTMSIVSIGRLVPTKGHDVLVNACAKLVAQGMNLKVQIIGSGPLESDLRKLVSTLGVDEHIIFLGAVAFDDVLQTLEHADVFALAPRLLPGHPPDGIPNVIAEAMALGIPVVTTRVSAIPELVSDGKTGCLVEVDDIDGFAQAIASILTNPELACSHSEAARERVAELFNQDANIDELLELFGRYIKDDFISPALPRT